MERRTGHELGKCICQGIFILREGFNTESLKQILNIWFFETKTDFLAHDSAISRYLILESKGLRKFEDVLKLLFNVKYESVWSTLKEDRNNGLRDMRELKRKIYFFKGLLFPPPSILHIFSLYSAALFQAPCSIQANLSFVRLLPSSSSGIDRCLNAHIRTWSTE